MALENVITERFLVITERAQKLIDLASNVLDSIAESLFGNRETAILSRLFKCQISRGETEHK